MTAHGAGTASNVVPVAKQVIGCAWYNVLYAAGYSSISIFIESSTDIFFESELDWYGEKILSSREK